LPWEKKGKRWCRKRGFVWAWENAIKIAPALAYAVRDKNAVTSIAISIKEPEAPTNPESIFPYNEDDWDCRLIITCGSLALTPERIIEFGDEDEEVTALRNENLQLTVETGELLAREGLYYIKISELESKVEKLELAHERDMRRAAKLMGELREAHAEIDRLKA